MAECDSAVWPEQSGCWTTSPLRGDNQDFDGGNGFNLDNGADSNNGPFGFDDDDPTDQYAFRLASLLLF